MEDLKINGIDFNQELDNSLTKVKMSIKDNYDLIMWISYFKQYSVALFKAQSHD